MTLPTTPEAFQAFLGRFDEGGSAEGLLLCLRDTGAIAGNVNINIIIRGRFQCGSLGYATFAPYAGCGYMGLRDAHPAVPQFAVRVGRLWARWDRMAAQAGSAGSSDRL
jgi:hypothetical protein